MISEVFSILNDSMILCFCRAFFPFQATLISGSAVPISLPPRAPVCDGVEATTVSAGCRGSVPGLGFAEQRPPSHVAEQGPPSHDCTPSACTIRSVMACPMSCMTVPACGP